MLGPNTIPRAETTGNARLGTETTPGPSASSADRSKCRNNTSDLRRTLAAPCHDLLPNVLSLVVGHLWIQRQAEDLPARLLRVRQPARPQRDTVLVGGLAMHRNGVMDQGADALGLQVTLELIPAPGPNDVQME